MRESAFGALDLTHAEFARLTPGELQERLQGYKWRHDRDMQRMALLASWLINAIAAPKRPVNPVVLLGLEDEYSPTTGERRLTPQELEDSKRELIERLGG